MGDKQVKSILSKIGQKTTKKGTVAKAKAATKKTLPAKKAPKKSKVEKTAPEKPKTSPKKKAAAAKKTSEKKVPENPTKKRGGKSPRTGSRRKEGTRACQDRFLEALANNRFCIYRACKEAGIARQTFYHWRDKDKAFMARYDEFNEAKIDAWEEALHRNIVAGAEVSTIFGLKTKGRKRGYGDKPMPSKEAVAIINRLLADEITTREAAYRLWMIGEKIPDAMKIELEKTPPDMPPPELPPAMSDEELEERYQKGLARQNQQRDDFVPKRREEVQAIKEELKGIESFGPDAEMRTGDCGQSQE